MCEKKDNIFGVNKFDIYNPGSNSEVTTYYVDIIRKSLDETGIETTLIKEMNLNEENGKKGIVVTSVSDIKIARKNKYHKIVCWIQGVAPEEYLLYKKNFFMYICLSLVERKRMRKADYIFFCSEKMKRHYEKKYFCHFSNSYIMPCFNEEINVNRIREKDYSKNIFVYAGSLAKWQCFEKTVDTYKEIEKVVPNAEFRIYVKDKEIAKEILDSKNVKNYLIDYVSPEQLKEKLVEVQYGFCIRERITVNKVATPTKLSNYIANGIIPVYSTCLSSFYECAKASKYCIGLGSVNDIKKYFSTEEKNIIGEDVLEDFQRTFGDYYSSIYHVNNIVRSFLIDGKERTNVE